jgi:3'-phosphoadenosine 5'-phosphosulfate sulfotransferase
MSHFTHIKTRFQNLDYLKKALSRLNISYNEKVENLDSNIVNLTIPQSNGYDIEFAWNGEQYELVIDMSFWQQSSPIESFIDKVAQTYAGEVIISESQKTGFQAIKYQQNNDGSNTLVLERWNHEKIVAGV